MTNEQTALLIQMIAREYNTELLPLTLELPETQRDKIHEQMKMLTDMNFQRSMALVS